ncbi:uncharacterized protein LOC135092397 [Scylla paramamosain]|uniref:uncharacterized protein LOC135092397 n=1 Tax=Scylla paramamosain TaxID=85552 RepID=UPI0030831C5A
METGTHRGKPAAMPRVLQLPLVLLLSLSLGDFPTPALAQNDCNAADVVVERGEQHSFPNKEVQILKASMTLFVKTESSFEGIIVSVHGIGGIEYTAWFPAEAECFPHDDTWHQLLAFTEIKKENSTINFGFETGSCLRICKRDKTPLGLWHQRLVAHGTSRWRTKFPPSSCATFNLNTISSPPKLPICKEPPAPVSVMTIIIIAIVVLLFVVGLLVVAVRVIEKKNWLWAKSYTSPNNSPAGQTTCAEGNLQ